MQYIFYFSGLTIGLDVLKPFIFLIAVFFLHSQKKKVQKLSPWQYPCKTYTMPPYLHLRGAYLNGTYYYLLKEYYPSDSFCTIFFWACITHPSPTRWSSSCSLWWSRSVWGAISTYEELEWRTRWMWSAWSNAGAALWRRTQRCLLC